MKIDIPRNIISQLFDVPVFREWVIDKLFGQNDEIRHNIRTLMVSVGAINNKIAAIKALREYCSTNGYTRVHLQNAFPHWTTTSEIHNQSGISLSDAKHFVEYYVEKVQN